MNFQKIPSESTFKNKSVSLPKIKTHGAESPPKRPLGEMHKVKWSIAPKCLLPGHEGREILYICIKPDCKEQTRLVCEQCFFKEHQKHNEEFLAMDEIRSGNIEKLRYWPFDLKYRKIFEFITKHESYVSNMVQDVNATFNVLTS